MSRSRSPQRENRSPSRIAKDMATSFGNQSNFDDRLKLLKQTTGIQEYHVEEYSKTEVMRNAIAHVQKQAVVNEMTRKSPAKIYRGVKSKLAGNRKSIHKAQARQQFQDELKYFNPNDTIQSIIDKSKNDYISDRLNTSGDQYIASQNISRVQSPGSYTGVLLSGSNSQARIASTFKHEKQQDMMYMIEQKINEKYGKREVTRTVDWEKGQAVPIESPKLSQSINWENGQTQPLDGAPEPQPLPAQAQSQVDWMQSNKEQYDQVTRDYHASQYAPTGYNISDFTKSETYQKMAYQDKLKKSQVDKFNDSFATSVTEQLFKQEIKHKKDIRNLAGSLRCSSPMKLDQMALIQDITKVSSHHQQINQKSAKKAAAKGKKGKVSNVKHPKKQGYQQVGRLESEFNRVVARELYIDSTVNEVSALKKGKVVPGQMNLFHPQGQNVLTVEANGPAEGKEDGYDSPTSSHYIDQIKEIYQDEGGAHNLKDPQMQKKTQAVQDQFELLMNEMSQRRDGAKKKVFNAKAIDEILDGYYEPGPERKHKSPTKRLVQHKNSTTKHKQRIQDTLHKGDYSQTYNISPGKSYVIEPQGGELPYEIAEQSPKKFYNQVLNQDIKKCTINKERGTLSWIWTQRPILKIISSIKSKVMQRLENELGSKYAEDINKAMAEGHIDEHLNDMIENQQIDLVDQNNNLVLQKQITHLTNIDEANEHETPSNTRGLESPDAHKLDRANLEVHEKRYSELQGKVVDYVRKNSLLADAKTLKVLQDDQNQ